MNEPLRKRTQWSDKRRWGVMLDDLLEYTSAVEEGREKRECVDHVLVT